MCGSFLWPGRKKSLLRHRWTEHLKWLPIKDIERSIESKHKVRLHARHYNPETEVSWPLDKCVYKSGKREREKRRKSCWESVSVSKTFQLYKPEMVSRKKKEFVLGKSFFVYPFPSNSYVYRVRWRYPQISISVLILLPSWEIPLGNPIS